MSNINERIRLVRKQNNLTQETFAKALNLSREHISRIENEKENPSNETIETISYTFSVDKDWLLYGTGNMKNRMTKNNQHLKIITSDLIKELLETNNTAKLSNFANIIIELRNVLTLPNIKNNSDLYYGEQVKQIIYLIIAFLKVSTIEEYDDALKDNILSETFKKIKNLLQEASSAFLECDLNNLLDSDER